MTTWPAPCAGPSQTAAALRQRSLATVPMPVGRAGENASAMATSWRCCPGLRRQQRAVWPGVGHQHAAKQTLNRVDGSARAEQTMRLRRMCRLFCIPDGDVCSRGVWLHGQGGGTVSYPGRLGDRAAEGRRVDVLIGFECIWRVLPVCRCYGSDASEFGWRWLASCWGCW